MRVSRGMRALVLFAGPGLLCGGAAGTGGVGAAGAVAGGAQPHDGRTGGDHSRPRAVAVIFETGAGGAGAGVTVERSAAVVRCEPARPARPAGGDAAPGPERGRGDPVALWVRRVGAVHRRQPPARGCAGGAGRRGGCTATVPRRLGAGDARPGRHDLGAGHRPAQAGGPRGGAPGHLRGVYDDASTAAALARCRSWSGGPCSGRHLRWPRRTPRSRRRTSSSARRTWTRRRRGRLRVGNRYDEITSHGKRSDPPVDEAIRQIVRGEPQRGNCIAAHRHVPRARD